MRSRLVFIAISILVGVEAASRGRNKHQRQLPFPGQPDATEEAWTHGEVHKLERRPDSRQDDAGTSTAENLDDTVVVGDFEMPVPESPNASRQLFPGWIQTAPELPKPIAASINSAPLAATYAPQQPPHQPSEQPYEVHQDEPQPPEPNPTLPPGCLAPRGQYPSPNNCANYLNCWDDVVIEEICPNALLFNDVTGLCDFEYNVNCGARPAATPKPPLPAGSKRCPDVNGRYRSASNCSEFFICLSGSPIKFSCPPGLVYNDAVSVCDYLYNVDCQGAATPTPAPLSELGSLDVPISGLQGLNQTQRPQPTFPPSAYPDNSWLGREAETDPWHQRSVASQPELDAKQETSTGNSSEVSVEGEPTETPTVQSPWDLMHSIPEELNAGPCENGSVHRLDDACTSVVVCRNKRPQLVQCPQGLTYDRPSDSCRHFNIAKC